MGLQWVLLFTLISVVTSTEMVTTTMMDTEMSETTTELGTTEMPVAMEDKMDTEKEPEAEPQEESIADVNEDTMETARSFSSSAYAPELFRRIYDECIQRGSIACIKPKVLSFLSTAVKKDNIHITDTLSIVKNSKSAFTEMEESPEYLEESLPKNEDERKEAMRLLVLDKVDKFLSTHDLKVRIPKEIVSGQMLPFVPKFLLDNIPSEVRVPLSDSHTVQERGLMKKVVIPFLLGLKFKATALIPLALAFVALKTWKALTLGLLSLVLSGAMLILRGTKQKVVSYEVVHYPQHSPHSYDHVAYDRGSFDYSPYEHGYARSFSAQPLAYRAYPK